MNQIKRELETAAQAIEPAGEVRAQRIAQLLNCVQYVADAANAYAKADGYHTRQIHAQQIHDGLLAACGCYRVAVGIQVISEVALPPEPRTRIDRGMRFRKEVAV